MQLLVPQKIIHRLTSELRRAGRYEIGGVLMGEFVSEGIFRVVEISVQNSRGSAACFTRDPAQHNAELEHFFDRTGRDYCRFNYLGEWHSHPGFRPLPSSTDVNAMQAIVDDPSVGATFVLLLIVRLAWSRRLEMSATAFQAGGSGRTPVSLSITIEADGTAATNLTWLQKLFRFR